MSESAETALPIHPDNYRLRMDFLAYCRSGGMSAAAVQPRSATTLHLLRCAGNRPLSDYSVGDLKALLPTASHLRQAGASLSHERLRKVFEHSRELLEFACLTQNKRFSRIDHRHLRNLKLDKAHYLTNAVPGVSIAEDRRPFYTLEELLQIAGLDLTGDLMLWRAQACACLEFAGGLRIGAVATLPLYAINLDTLRVRQDPKIGVHTKNAKYGLTMLLDIGELLAPVRSWAAYLAKRATDQAMFYNVFDRRFDMNGLQQPTNNPPGNHRAIALADDYPKLCARAGVPYRGSHAFRHGHIVYCARRCKDLADFSALSKNVMHSDLRTTMLYAQMGSDEVASQYRVFSQPAAPGSDLSNSVDALSKVVNTFSGDSNQQALMGALLGSLTSLLNSANK